MKCELLRWMIESEPSPEKKLGCSWKGKRLVDVLYQEHLIQLSAWTKAQCASSGTLITALTLNG